MGLEGASFFIAAPSIEPLLMPIEEAGGYCDYCQRPVLGRRQGVNHVVWVLFGIFTCGLLLIVWLFVVLASSSEPYACPNCGRRIRAGASGPIPPPSPPRELAPEELAALAAAAAVRRRQNRNGVLTAAAVIAALIAIAFWQITEAERRRTGPLPGLSPSPSPVDLWREVAEIPDKTGNRYHDATVHLDDVRREKLFHDVITAGGGDCPVASRISYRDMDERKNSNWRVACVNGRFYVVTLKNDRSRSSAIQQCERPASDGSMKCFGTR